MRQPALRIHWLLAVTCATFVGTQTTAATIDFDTLAVGNTYGEAVPNVEGQVVLVENGISMSVERFNFGTFSDFFEATVIGPDPVAFSTNSLSLNNINVAFDFTQLGFTPDMVSIEFRDLGGSSSRNNFSVNGIVPIELASLTDIPAVPVGGITATVSNNQIILNGDVEQILIGGQELIIDNLFVVPEPTSVLLLAMGCGVLLRRRYIMRR